MPEARPYTETVAAGGSEYTIAAITLKEARLVDWEGPEFMSTLILASLTAGGSLPEGTTLVSLESLPYMQVYLPLWKAARRVNGLSLPGEAQAAPEPVGAADSISAGSTAT